MENCRRKLKACRNRQQNMRNNYGEPMPFNNFYDRRGMKRNYESQETYFDNKRGRYDEEHYYQDNYNFNNNNNYNAGFKFGQNFNYNSKGKYSANNRLNQIKANNIRENNNNNQPGPSNKCGSNVVPEIIKSQTLVIPDTPKCETIVIPDSPQSSKVFKTPGEAPGSGKKNIAASRLKNLRQSLELQKTEEQKTEPTANNQEMCVDGNGVQISPIESPQTVTLQTPMSDTLKESTQPKDNFSDISMSQRFEKKIDKNSFTSEWVQNTNFDGDSSSFMEVSTYVRASDTVADLDTINEDVIEMEWNTEVNSKKVFAGIPKKSQDVCVVVDTNIFMHNLDKIKDIVRIKVSGAVLPVILIPWMVIQELDYLKDSNKDFSVKKSAFTAIKYINELLGQSHPRLIGQTIFEVDKQRDMGIAPDDKIISCCLQALEKYEFVFVFSNDINLKNKAMIHNIPAYSTSEIVIRIMAKLNKAGKVQAVLTKMGMTCTYIIVECMKDCYGAAWSKMDMMTSEQPWPFMKCLKILKRYWATVFREKLLKQFLRTVDQILTFLNSGKHICDDSKEYIDFVKMCVTLCIFFKDMPQHRNVAEKTISDITILS